ncbi:efflux RND transporter periplasmic adaptor subunit [Aromatoleum petrolei]|uniref:Efflux RND transporter periplasmic adaptor subunit n=1 Tax=Aromatoleum petrolei TaxID=76116 RepID=A0ABX1MIP6_9RHOO|nr:efflux RND transporter periplasmic adaptor subunit [Aromatoleum petrolei]NMF87818.1 efflux RND transporter periplasmic adaptor subunit [Aromatoleum petrolei]QTQ35316.1 RND family efflux transporter, MFP subunit [Aromatoleum petrolei]
MKRRHSERLTVLLPTIALAILGACSAPNADTPQSSPNAATSAARPALTVEVTIPQPVAWSRSIPATGNVAAWQETIVGSEIGGLRIAQVHANVGDRVTKGQILVTLDDAVVQADLAQARAQLQEARAMHAEARANGDRARRFQPTGMMSEQQVTQYLTAEQTAKSRIELAAARVQLAELRVRQTRILAPDDALISGRAATVGTVPQAGQELYRLILQGRLEWRAEVAAEDIGQIRSGDAAKLKLAGGETVSGRVRSIAPSIDPQTRNGIVYVDLDQSGAKAGMFANGEIIPLAQELAHALSLPQSAVLLRDGFSYVFRIGSDRKLAQVRVTPGRRRGDSMEILAGIAEGERFVRSGVGFLNDGDLVDIAAATPAASPQQ